MMNDEYCDTDYYSAGWRDSSFLIPFQGFPPMQIPVLS